MQIPRCHSRVPDAANRVDILQPGHCLISLNIGQGCGVSVHRGRIVDSCSRSATHRLRLSGLRWNSIPTAVTNSSNTRKDVNPNSRNETKTAQLCVHKGIWIVDGCRQKLYTNAN